MQTSGVRRVLTTAALAIFFLFFFQLLSDLIEPVYAFGLLSTEIPIEIVSVLILFSPLLLVITPRYISRSVLIFCGELMLLYRLVEPLLDTRGRWLSSITTRSWVSCSPIKWVRLELTSLNLHRSL